MQTLIECADALAPIIDECKEALGGEDMSECRHESVKVEFDEEDCKSHNYSSEEVQRRWPRFHGICPDCGKLLIKYASTAHYIWGDW